MIPYTLESLLGRSLADVEAMAKYGSIPDSLVTEYIRAWNAGPHFTQAVWCDGAIRQFDPELTPRRYASHWEKYGVRP